MKKLGLFFFITLLFPQRFSEQQFVHKLVTPVSKKSPHRNVGRVLAKIKEQSKSSQIDHIYNYKKNVNDPPNSSSPPNIPINWMGELISIRRDLAYIHRNQWRGQRIVSELGQFYIIQQDHSAHASWPYVVENQYGEYYGFHPKIRFKPRTEQERIKFEDEYGLELEQEIEPLNLVYYKVDRLSPEKVLQLANNTQIKPEFVKILRR